MVDFIHKFRQVLSSNTPCNMQCPEKDKRRCFGDDHIFNKHVQEPLYRFAFSKCLNQPLYRFNDDLHTSLPIVVLAILVLSSSMMKIGKCMVLLFRRSIGLVDSNRLTNCSVPDMRDIVDFDNFVRPVLWCVCSSMRAN